MDRNTFFLMTFICGLYCANSASLEAQLEEVRDIQLLDDIIEALKLEARTVKLEAESHLKKLQEATNDDSSWVQETKPVHQETSESIPFRYNIDERGFWDKFFSKFTDDKQAENKSGESSENESDESKPNVTAEPYLSDHLGEEAAYTVAGASDVFDTGALKQNNKDILPDKSMDGLSGSGEISNEASDSAKVDPNLKQGVIESDVDDVIFASDIIVEKASNTEESSGELYKLKDEMHSEFSDTAYLKLPGSEYEVISEDDENMSGEEDDRNMDFEEITESNDIFIRNNIKSENNDVDEKDERESSGDVEESLVVEKAEDASEDSSSGEEDVILRGTGDEETSGEVVEQLLSNNYSETANASSSKRELMIEEIRQLVDDIDAKRQDVASLLAEINQLTIELENIDL